MAANTGKVVQVIGPVIDVSFADEQNLPNIYDSLVIKRADGSELVLECQQHVGEDTVRTISMEATDGIARGTEVINTGQPIVMPTGDEVKGRLFNVT
ncbi:MAG: F0F1 ATP synthase subunit beta, partial [Bacteroidota bacterium]